MAAKYKPRLGLLESERAIKFIKDDFERRLARMLNLTRVSAPIVVTRASGVNDYLNGVERPVRFDVPSVDHEVEVVQSLAKWKRTALADYGIKRGEGIYTDMNALRRDEAVDHLHSVYVDQWDWERVVIKGERNLRFLKSIVKKIYRAIRSAEKAVCKRYLKLGKPYLPRDIHFVHAEELYERYPKISPVAREHAICNEKKAVFVIGIGAPLPDGTLHDGRAPDYDDWWTMNESGWRGLNGDIIVWNPVLKSAFELSSMGIRVDEKSLRAQLKLRKRKSSDLMPFHKRVLTNELPPSIGGGIGQSRLCMLFMRAAHIGEVQSSVWPPSMRRRCRKQGIELL